MSELRNNFTAGKLNLDIDERLLQKGQYRTASNIRIANSNGSDVGAIEKSLSNQQITTLTLGDNVFTVGGTSDEFEEKLYWLVKSDSGSYIIEHDVANNITSFVLQDTRAENVLGLDENYLVTGIVIVVDTDNNNRFLIYTDFNKQPRCINIERAKTYGLNGFEEEEILLIKKPPLNPPLITLSKTETEEENNIEEKFLIFFSRFKYLDGEYSAFSPASEVAFEAKTFNFDFSTSTNESMINEFNLVDLEIETGSKLVTDVEVIFKESQHNNLYLVEKYNKAEKGWSNDVTETIQFSNNKNQKTISENQLFRLFDAVPLKAKTLDIINNLIVFGNYTEKWNLIDKNDTTVNVDVKLDVVSEEVTYGSSYKSNKSNRDIEVGLVYGENYGRHTTALTSENNTIHIPSGSSDKKNNLKLTVKNPPPKFADWFRVCIKQNRYEYHTIVPTLFYQDGGFVWIKLETADIDKISAGDFVYVKSDSQGILPTARQAKIIEIEKKERNFLETEVSEESETIKQQSGTYYKIKPKNFRVNIQDIDVYEYSSYEDTLLDGNRNPIAVNQDYIQSPVYYGESGVDDLRINEASPYTHNEDVRYLVEIDGTGDGITDFDTFKWSKDNGSTWEAENVVITKLVQDLDNGVQIIFVLDTGHNTTDKWYIGAKSSSDYNLGVSESGRGYSIFKGSEDDVVYGGARIELIYDEFSNTKDYIEKTFISSQNYANIEEWYYRDNIIDELDIDENRIWFRRGIVTKSGWRDRSHQINITNDGSGTMNLIIRSKGFVNTFLESPVRVRITFNIRQTENVMLFETKSKDVNSDVFYEIGRTYPIVDGFHTSGFGNDINQTLTKDLKITLPHYNCFAWGNGFESIKIKDLFNTDSYKFETRPNSTIEDYRQNNRIAGLRRGQPYSQTLNYNGLNEFNLSLNINKDLDDSKGAIQIINEFNGDLDVYQEDKVSRALFDKTVLYNQDGTSNLTKSDLPFNSIIPYSGEFGISTSPESLVKHGNYRYWADEKRGVWLRKGQSGIEIISNNGMVDWFRDYFRNNKNEKNLSSFDPYYGQLTIAVKDYTLTFDEKVKGFTSFHGFKPDWMLRLNNDFFSIKNGQLYKHNVEGIGYNNFYNEQFKSEITTYFNDESSLDKIYKTLVLESTNSWKATLKTNHTESHIKSAEFNKGKADFLPTYVNLKAKQI